MLGLQCIILDSRRPGFCVFELCGGLVLVAGVVVNWPRLGSHGSGVCKGHYCRLTEEFSEVW